MSLSSVMPKEHITIVTMPNIIGLFFIFLPKSNITKNINIKKIKETNCPENISEIVIARKFKPRPFD